MKGNLQIADKLWGYFRRITAIRDPAGNIYGMPLTYPKTENSKTAQIKWTIRDFQAELARLKKEGNLLRFQPCRGDVGLRQKEEAMESMKERIRSLDEKIWERERKLREFMPKATLNSD